MARIRIVDSWLRSPASPPAHQRAVMIVADAWAEQRVLMRAYANCPDQTRPTIVLHGVHLAIGPAGLDPHGPWGIHVEPPADGRAQELRAQLELAARRLAGSKGNPPRLMDEAPSFDRKHTNTWAPGTPPDLPPPSGQHHQEARYYEPSASWQAANGPPPPAPDMSGAFAGGPPPPAPPPGASYPPPGQAGDPGQPGQAHPAPSWQHAPPAAPYPAPGAAGSYPPPAQQAGSYRASPGYPNQGWPGNQSGPRGWTSPVPGTPPLRDTPPVRPSGYPAASASEHRGAAHAGRAGASTAYGFAGGEGARVAPRSASGPGPGQSGRMASIVGRTMPVGFQLSAAERNVLDALGEAMQLSATQVARIAGVHDGTVWMATFMAKLAGFGLDVIAPGPYTGTEPTYTLRR